MTRLKSFAKKGKVTDQNHVLTVSRVFDEGKRLMSAKEVADPLCSVELVRVWGTTATALVNFKIVINVKVGSQSTLHAVMVTRAL